MELIDLLREGIERAAEFVKLYANDKKHATKRADLTGYDETLLSKILTIRESHGLILLNYSDAAQFVLSDEKLEWSPFLRVARGTVFEPNGTLISFPFHKFFNANEKPETKDSEVARWQVRSITEKVDGVMIQVFEHNGDLMFASRHGIWSNASITAFKLAYPAVLQIWRNIPFKRATLICELIHPNHRTPGMVNYGDLQTLVLLAIRNLDNFELIPAHEIFKGVALPEPLMLPQVYNDLMDYWAAKELVASQKTHEWEGVVLQGAGALGNQLVKIKNPYYIERVAFIKSLSPQKLIDAYANGGWDDVNFLLAGAEEILQEKPTLSSTLEQIKQVEQTVMGEIEKLADKPITEIPTHLRWIKTYEKDSNKWNTAFRKVVVRELEKVKKARR